jgi:hypothetical protein
VKLRFEGILTINTPLILKAKQKKFQKLTAQIGKKILADKFTLT